MVRAEIMAKRRTEKTDKEKFLLSLCDTIGDTGWLGGLSRIEWDVIEKTILPTIEEESSSRKCADEYW